MQAHCHGAGGTLGNKTELVKVKSVKKKKPTHMIAQSLNEETLIVLAFYEGGLNFNKYSMR